MWEGKVLQKNSFEYIFIYFFKVFSILSKAIRLRNRLESETIENRIEFDSRNTDAADPCHGMV